MNSSNTTTSSPFIFSKKNYIIMGIGILFIMIGFYAMTGYDANTRPNGVYDPNYWNENIFSWRRVHLAPILIIIGFVIEIIAILYPFKNK